MYDFSSFGFPEPKEDDPYYNRVAPGKTGKIFCISIFLRIERVLLPRTTANAFLEIFLMNSHLPMASNDVLPAFLGEVDLVTLPIFDNPTYS